MSHAAAILTTTNLYTDIPKLSAIDNILQFGHELLDEHRIKILCVAGARNDLPPFLCESTDYFCLHVCS